MFKRISMEEKETDVWSQSKQRLRVSTGTDKLYFSFWGTYGYLRYIIKSSEVLNKCVCGVDGEVK